jgi:hypothetical protein
MKRERERERERERGRAAIYYEQVRIVFEEHNTMSV